MSAIFTPTPVEQQAYTQPSDGDNKDTASIQAFLQGLADGQATHAKVGFDWTKGTSAVGLTRGAWSPVEQSWYAVAPGGSDSLQVSYDGGHTWTNMAPGAAGIACEDVAVATNGASKGNVVIVASGSRTVYLGAVSAYATVAWSTEALKLTASPTSGCVKLTFEPVRNAWIACYRSGGTGLYVDHTTDGITWAAGVLPGAWAYAGVLASPQINANALGLTVAWFYDDTTQLYRIAFSSDAGATWTEATTIPAPGAFTPTAIGRPAYDDVLGEWYLVASKTAARVTHVLRSTDAGVTWVDTGAATTDMALQDVVAINGVLVGVNDDGRIFRSVDRGVHWSLVVTNPIVAAARPYLRKGDGQLAVWNVTDKTIYVTPRLGATGGTAQ